MNRLPAALACRAGGRAVGQLNPPAAFISAPYARIGEGTTEWLTGIFAGDLDGQADDRGIAQSSDDPLSLLRKRFDRQQARLMRSDIVGLGQTHPVLLGENHVIAERSEEHTSELQSLMRLSSAVFCLPDKTLTNQ